MAFKCSKAQVNLKIILILLLSFVKAHPLQASNLTDENARFKPLKLNEIMQERKERGGGNNFKMYVVKSWIASFKMLPLG